MPPIGLTQVSVGLAVVGVVAVRDRVAVGVDGLGQVAHQVVGVGRHAAGGAGLGGLAVVGVVGVGRRVARPGRSRSAGCRVVVGVGGGAAAGGLGLADQAVLGVVDVSRRVAERRR